MSEQGDERPVYTGVCATCGGFDQPRDYCRNCGWPMTPTTTEPQAQQGATG